MSPSTKSPSEDCFRPRHEPARQIYDALVKESELRNQRSLEEWVRLERERVFKEATQYAQENELPLPTLEAIVRAENSACGHTDYMAKWAYHVAELLQKKS